MRTTSALLTLLLVACQSARQQLTSSERANDVRYIGEVFEFLAGYSMHQSVPWNVLCAKCIQEVEEQGALTWERKYEIISACLDRLGDPHTRFINPEESMRMRSPGPHNSSLGILVAPIDRSVAMVFPGGPAALAGVKVGERIVGIDGVGIESMADDEVRLLLRKATESEAVPVALSMIGRDGRTRAVTVHSGPVSLMSLPYVRRLDNDIGYLELPAGSSSVMWSLYAQTANDCVASLGQGAIRGWVIDLRRNTGGNPSGMLAAIGGFAGPGVIGGMVTRSGATKWEYEAGRLSFGGRLVATVEKPVSVPSTVPVAVLLSDVTASAAEAVAIALRGRDSVRMFGSRTYGATTTTVSPCLRDSAQLVIADGYMVDRNGASYWSGVVPDESVAMDWGRFGERDDPTVVAACDWIAVAAGSRK